jgi:hypothetical protein
MLIPKRIDDARVFVRVAHVELLVVAVAAHLRARFEGAD